MTSEPGHQSQTFYTPKSVTQSLQQLVSQDHIDPQPDPILSNPPFGAQEGDKPNQA